MAKTSKPSKGNLALSDHTTVMRAVIEHRGFLRDSMGVVGYRALGITPPPKHFFECLLKAPGLERDTAARIEVVLNTLHDFEAAFESARWTAPEQVFLASVRRAVRSAPSARGKIRALRTLADNYRDRQAEFSKFIGYAIEVLEDGIGVIYQDAGTPDAGTPDARPDAPESDESDNGDEKEVEEDCAGEDVIGAIAGALHGGLAGAIIGGLVHSGICEVLD